MNLEMIEAGWFSLLPPLIAITLALLTKEVYSSLFLGILTGMFVYCLGTDGNVLQAVTYVFDMIAAKIGENGYMIIFLVLLGSLVVVVSRSGGSNAYGEWAGKRIKNKTSAKLTTALLGLLIFVDDGFNCLTVGTVMRPVTDKCKVSREKLAYLLDATAAPICIIAPISSWAVAVASEVEEAGGLNAFIRTIPYNLYAILTIAMVFFLSVTDLDFGPMKKAEESMRPKESMRPDENMRPKESMQPKESIRSKENIHSEENIRSEAREAPETAKHPLAGGGSGRRAVSGHSAEFAAKKGRVPDLAVPILTLIVCSILGMAYVGGYFEGRSFAEAIGENPTAGLTLGTFAALLTAMALYIPRRLMNLREFMDGVVDGIKTMIPALLILILAWALGGVCREMIGTGLFVSNFVTKADLSLSLLPAVVFTVAAFLSFSMGTAWGTFGILLPIVSMICVGAEGADVLIPSLGATLAGSVFGDHCSPISDTTILASTGAQCEHLKHVETQLPYAVLVAAVCFAGYLVAGFVRNPWITIAASVLLLFLVFAVLLYLEKKSGRAAGK